jgi:hypothetical protein
MAGLVMGILLCNRKTRNGFINLLHEVDGFLQSYDNALGVSNVFLAESKPFAIFQPFLTDLITANVKLLLLIKTLLKLSLYCVAGLIYSRSQWNEDGVQG